MKILDFLIGVRVSPEVEDAGLDISEHAERAYADEEEFKLEMDAYVESLEDKGEFFFNKKEKSEK
jgi:Amt family ammonium transporter